MLYGDKLLQLRRLVGITQVRLQALSGINAAFISMYERGHRPLTADQLTTIERILNEELDRKTRAAKRLVSKSARQRLSA